MAHAGRREKNEEGRRGDVAYRRTVQLSQSKRDNYLSEKMICQKWSWIDIHRDKYILIKMEPFACSQCGKTFIQRKTFIQMKPFACNRYDKTVGV